MRKDWDEYFMDFAVLAAARSYELTNVYKLEELMENDENIYAK